MGIRNDVESELIADAKATTKTVKKSKQQTRSRRTKPPLARAIKNGQPKEVYLKLCEDVACHMYACESGRDYAAMSKSFMQAYELYCGADDEDEVKAADAIKQEAANASPIANAQKKFQVVVNDKMVANG